ILTGNRSYMCTAVYEPLVLFDAQWNAHPLLADSWKSNGTFTEWTLNLRQNVHFHDGSAFTAKDVSYTLKRILNKGLGSALYARLSASLAPNGINIVNDHTIVFHL